MERTELLLLLCDRESTYMQWTCLKNEKKNHFSYQLHQKDKKCTESLKLLPFTRQNLLPRYNWKQNQVAVHAALFETYLAQWRHATSHLFNDNFLCELVIISTYH